MSACACARACERMYACVCVRARVRMFCVRRYVYTCVYVFKYACVYACVDLRVREYACVIVYSRNVNYFARTTQVQLYSQRPEVELT